MIWEAKFQREVLINWSRAYSVQVYIYIYIFAYSLRSVLEIFLDAPVYFNTCLMFIYTSLICVDVA